jgi:hypothetical protein
MVNKRRDDGDLELVNASAKNHGPRTITMTEPDYARTNLKGIVRINWNDAQLLSNHASRASTETESSDDGD